MTTQICILEHLNLAIAEAETRGDRAWLEDVIASQLTFVRATGKIVDRATYLAGVAPSDMKTTVVEAIHINGNRASVSCYVTVHEPGGKKSVYHNFRLFIRDGERWLLLGWANEEVP